MTTLIFGNDKALDRMKPKQFPSKQNPFEAKMSVKRLVSEESIAQAKELLYSTYVVNEEWIPPIGNQSGLKVSEEKGRRVLTDDFDSMAFWYGLFTRDQLIGCYRTLERPHAEIEIERYRPLPNGLHACSRLVEANRFTLRSDYTGNLIAALEVIRHAIQRSLENDFSVFVATSKHNFQQILKKLGVCQIGDAFRYSESEIDYCKIYALMQSKQKQAVIVTCDQILSLLYDRVVRDSRQKEVN